MNTQKNIIMPDTLIRFTLIEGNNKGVTPKYINSFAKEAEQRLSQSGHAYTVNASEEGIQNALQNSMQYDLFGEKIKLLTEQTKEPQLKKLKKMLTQELPEEVRSTLKVAKQEYDKKIKERAQQQGIY